MFQAVRKANNKMNVDDENSKEQEEEKNFYWQKMAKTIL